MGYESPFAARRRLSDAAVSRAECFEEPLAAASLPFADIEVPVPVSLEGELERLALDLLDTPGAGGALLAAFAAQSRALFLVAEAAMRAPHAPLPDDVLARVRDVLQTAPTATSVLAVA